MKFILGKKINMTQVFRDNGTVVPVTRVQAGPCIVTQVRAIAEGSQAIQIGFDNQKLFRLSQAEQGHLKGITTSAGCTVRYLKEINTGAEKLEIKKGDSFSVKIFAPGDTVQVTGISKGKGFQGVVRRHGFKGGPASHGHKDNLRMPGSIGAGGVQRVFKNMRMGGHMGDDQVTVKNLEIVEVDAEKNELLIKGALPGSRNSLVFVYAAKGDIQVEMPVENAITVEPAEELKAEASAPVVVGEAN